MLVIILASLCWCPILRWLKSWNTNCYSFQSLCSVHGQGINWVSSKRGQFATTIAFSVMPESSASFVMFAKTWSVFFGQFILMYVVMQKRWVNVLAVLTELLFHHEDLSLGLHLSFHNFPANNVVCKHRKCTSLLQTVISWWLFPCNIPSVSSPTTTMRASGLC